MGINTKVLDSVAIIDLEPLTKNTHYGQQHIANQLSTALKQIGFFIIINHGIPNNLVKRTFEDAKRFHDQSSDAKHAVLMNEHNNGYMAINRYNVRTSRASDIKAKFDLNEAFFIKRERLQTDPLVKNKRRFAGPNEWPKNLPNFRENLIEYTDSIDRLAKSLLSPLAVSLKLPADTFDSAFAESQFSFRLSHYPAVDRRREDEYGIAPHTDANFMTFLAQTDVPGLQIKIRDKHWIDIPYIPNSFVVNSGDMLHRWTNGHYKSTPHRAIPPLGKSRYAIPFFFGPHLDAQIECLPTCHNEKNPPKFPPISYSDYIAWWYDENYNSDDQTDLAINQPVAAN